ncbi:hypothetical protein EDC04DRAFT_2609528 [Pisolithus marmoratus]|nr:hypothetical protein EDC04DRAFT_2609528 [Pisolithus marmoratus]
MSLNSQPTWFASLWSAPQTGSEGSCKVSDVIGAFGLLMIDVFLAVALCPVVWPRPRMIKKVIMVMVLVVVFIPGQTKNRVPRQPFHPRKGAQDGTETGEKVWITIVLVRHRGIFWLEEGDTNMEGGVLFPS